MAVSFPGGGGAFGALVSLAALLLAAHPARATFIDNLVPRRDTMGAIMDSHDFSIHKYPGTAGYTMVSIGYGECVEPAGHGCDSTPDHCGFQPNHTINVWSSLDLSSGSWSFVTTAVSVDNRPPGTIYRPDAIWNPHTQQVVLWYNWLNAAGHYEGYAAYTAPSPAGPYTRVRESVNVTIQNATSCESIETNSLPRPHQRILTVTATHFAPCESARPNRNPHSVRRLPSLRRPRRRHALRHRGLRFPHVDRTARPQHARQRGRHEPNGPL